MGAVHATMAMSLDGFIAGPGDSVANPLGDGGERLHQWMFELASWRERHGLEGGERGRDAEIVDESVARTGAAVMGRRMLQIHLAPILLGDGVRLFDGPGLEHVGLAPVRVVDSPQVTHIRYRASRSER